jgi:hypothetical protein
VDFVFIFANKFFSHSGAILLFHSDDLWVFGHIRKFLDNYSLLIRMKRVVVNSLPLISTKDFELKVLICSHILLILLCCCRLFISIFNAILSSCRVYLVEPHFWWGPLDFWVPSTYFWHIGAGIRVLEEDILYNWIDSSTMTLSSSGKPLYVAKEMHPFTLKHWLEFAQS